MKGRNQNDLLLQSIIDAVFLRDSDVDGVNQRMGSLERAEIGSFCE